MENKNKNKVKNDKLKKLNPFFIFHNFIIFILFKFRIHYIFHISHTVYIIYYRICLFHDYNNKKKLGLKTKISFL